MGFVIYETWIYQGIHWQLTAFLCLHKEFQCSCTIGVDGSSVKYMCLKGEESIPDFKCEKQQNIYSLAQSIRNGIISLLFPLSWECADVNYIKTGGEKCRGEGVINEHP